MPSVSICIPSYVTNSGRAGTLRSSVISGLAQDFDDFEVIVGSNASSFDVHPWLDDLKDPRLRVIYETEHLPMTKNVNRTISHAKGKIIKPLCDDDCLSCDFLKKTVPLAKKYQFVVTGICHRQEELGVKEGENCVYPKGVLPRNDCPCAFPAQIFTTGVYDALGGFDNRMYYFDYDFSFLAYYYFGGYYLAEKLLFFRRWNQSSSTVNPNIYIHYREAADTYAKLIGLTPFDADLRRICRKNMILATATMLKKPWRMFAPNIVSEYCTSMKRNMALIV